MLFGKKTQPLLGLDITTSSVKLIELTQSGKRFRVESYAAEPTPPSSVSEKAIVDAKAVGEAIRRAVKRAGAKATDVAVAISGDAAITKVIQMPSSLSERDLEGQVEIQADQYIPFPMEEVSFDFEVVGPNEKDPELMDVLLVATRTENVEQREAAVHAAGLDTHVVDVEAFALENACILERKGLDVDDVCIQAGSMYGGLSLLDVFGTCCNQQHIHEFRVFFIRSNDFEVEADLLHWKWNVLVGLYFDLPLEVSFRQARGHLNDFGNRRIAADRDCNVGRLSACSFDGAANRFADCLGINDCLFADRTRWCGLRSIRLDAKALAALRKLNELDRRCRDIEAQQWLSFLTE